MRCLSSYGFHVYIPLFHLFNFTLILPLRLCFNTSLDHCLLRLLLFTPHCACVFVSFCHFFCGWLKSLASHVVAFVIEEHRQIKTFSKLCEFFFLVQRKAQSDLWYYNNKCRIETLLHYRCYLFPKFFCWIFVQTLIRFFAFKVPVLVCNLNLIEFDGKRLRYSSRIVLIYPWWALFQVGVVGTIP